MEDTPVFKPVQEVSAVYDPATAEEGKLYLRLLPPEQTKMYANADDDEERHKICVCILGVICVVDHTGSPVDSGQVLTFDRHAGYNMAIEMTPNSGVRNDLHMRRGERGSVYVDMSNTIERRWSLFG